MRRRLLLLLLLPLLGAASRACALPCRTPGFALNGATCACERMRCAPRQRLLHMVGRVLCGPDVTDCAPCASRDDALEPAGCACVPVRPCADGQQWWRDARDTFACLFF